MLARRTAGEPLQYVLGAWGFRALDLFVDRRVLIPRPETEVTAGCALAELRRRAHESGGRGGVPLRSFTQAKVVAARPPAPPPPGSGDGTPTLLAADLGCGSGAIGLSLAAERVDVEVICTDVSADALAVASANHAG
ncbi:MAG: methyltransferase, partial [Acidimicrobiia bacterium]|nr:methyltransferase [Acidimicrobiia bacterium]